MMVTKVPDLFQLGQLKSSVITAVNSLKKKKLLSSCGLYTMSDYKALDINIEARGKPPEVISHQTNYRNGCKTFLCIKEEKFS